MAEPGPSQTRHETRLLIVTIGVSVAMLLVLARFRFPETGGPAPQPSPAPLERLAARATFDELASIMDDLWRRVSPSVAVVAVRGERQSMAYVPAIRVGGNRAIAVLSRDESVDSGEGARARVLARAAAGDLAALELNAPGPPVGTPAETSASGPRYVAIVEATASGPAVRPLYVGRTDPFEDPRGAGSLLRVTTGQQTLPRGAAVFSLDGEFIGLVTETPGGPAIVAASDVIPLAQSAPAAPAPQGDLGIDVQTLTPRLASATGAANGVVITRVRNGSSPPAVVSGDVVQSIDGTPVDSLATFQALSQTRTPGDVVKLGIVRRGTPKEVEVTAGDSTVDTPPPSQPRGDLGAILRTVTRAGAEVVAVSLDSAAAGAGLARGDLIVALNGGPSPDARAIERAYDRLAPGEAMLLTIQRAGEHRVLSLEKR